MIYIARACEEGHTKYESGNYKTIKLQTYGEINLQDVKLNFQNSFGDKESERFVIVSLRGDKKPIIPAMLVNFNDAEQMYLFENQGKELSKTIKDGKIIKFKKDNIACKVTCENGVFYATKDCDLLIYNL